MNNFLNLILKSLRFFLSHYHHNYHTFFKHDWQRINWSVKKGRYREWERYREQQNWINKISFNKFLLIEESSYKYTWAEPACIRPRPPNSNTIVPLLCVMCCSRRSLPAKIREPACLPVCLLACLLGFDSITAPCSKTTIARCVTIAERGVRFGTPITAGGTT